MLKYAYTILYVTDVSKTIAFYEEAFGFEKKFSTPENDYGEIISGETTIAFASIQLAGSNLKKGFLESNLNQKPFGIELGFVTDNPSEFIKKALGAGAVELEPLKTKPWGQEVAYLRDNNGFIIEICTPIDN
ncbi:MAG: VOC family protein [Aureispira sp.]|nr:VOC family protein [Aureispira sp.]